MSKASLIDWESVSESVSFAKRFNRQAAAANWGGKKEAKTEEKAVETEKDGPEGDTTKPPTDKDKKSRKGKKGKEKKLKPPRWAGVETDPAEPGLDTYIMTHDSNYDHLWDRKARRFRTVDPVSIDKITRPKPVIAGGIKNPSEDEKFLQEIVERGGVSRPEVRHPKRTIMHGKEPADILNYVFSRGAGKDAHKLFMDPDFANTIGQLIDFEDRNKSELISLLDAYDFIGEGMTIIDKRENAEDYLKRYIVNLANDLDDKNLLGDSINPLSIHLKNSLGLLSFMQKYDVHDYGALRSKLYEVLMPEVYRGLHEVNIDDVVKQNVLGKFRGATSDSLKEYLTELLRQRQAAWTGHVEPDEKHFVAPDLNTIVTMEGLAKEKEEQDYLRRQIRQMLVNHRFEPTESVKRRSPLYDWFVEFMPSTIDRRKRGLGPLPGVGDFTRINSYDSEYVDKLRAALEDEAKQDQTEKMYTKMGLKAKEALLLKRLRDEMRIISDSGRYTDDEIEEIWNKKTNDVKKFLRKLSRQMKYTPEEIASRQLQRDAKMRDAPYHGVQDLGEDSDEYFLRQVQIAAHEYGMPPLYWIDFVKFWNDFARFKYKKDTGLFLHPTETKLTANQQDALRLYMKEVKKANHLIFEPTTAYDPAHFKKKVVKKSAAYRILSILKMARLSPEEKAAYDVAIHNEYSTFYNWYKNRPKGIYKGPYGFEFKYDHPYDSGYRIVHPKVYTRPISIHVQPRFKGAPEDLMQEYYDVIVAHEKDPYKTEWFAPVPRRLQRYLDGLDPYEEEVEKNPDGLNRWGF